MSAERPFEAVLDAARSGQQWAWERLYRDLAPSVMGYFRARRVPDPEDLVGDTFVGVLRDLHRFKGDERDFRAWVLTIAHRRYVDAVRRGTRPAELPEPPLAGDAEADAMARVGDRDTLELISSLSPDQQDVLLLRVFGDLTIAQIAKALGKRPGAVKALQRRALDALAKKLS